MLSPAVLLTAQEDQGTVKKWKEIITKDGSKPIARHEAAFVGVGDNFYLLGGRGIKPVSIYDVKKDTWTQGAPSPIEMHHFQPIVFEGKIYVIGALTGGYPSETPIPDIYVYSPKEDRWSKEGTIPKKRRRGSTGNVVYKNQVYISGGIQNGHIDGHKKWLDRYNPVTKKWKKLADAPRARDHFQSAVTGGKIYALAGRLSKAPNATFVETIAEVDVYDIAADSWETLSEPIPTPRAGNIAIGVGSDIYIMGGESATQETAHAQVEVLDCMTGAWRTLPEMTSGRHGTGVILHNRQLYIASGCANRGGEPELDTMEQYVID